MFSPKSTDLFAGFDCGGTKIVLSVENPEGNIVYRSRREMSGNIASAGGLAVAGAMAEMLSEISTGGEVIAVCSALAGYSNETQLALFKEEFRRRIPPGCEFFAMPDFEIFFHCDWNDFSIGKTGGRHSAALVIAGTGSVVIGALPSPDDGYVRAFGRGAFISDPGSGFDLGLRFVRRFLYSCDTGEAGQAVSELLRKAGYNGADELAAFLNVAGPEFKRRVASFATLLIDAARIPDQAGYRKDLESSCAELAAGTAFVLSRISSPADPGHRVPEILLSGGLITGSKEYRELFTRLLRNATGTGREIFVAPADVSGLCADYSHKKIAGEF